MPKISIITVAYNNRLGLEETINNILSQSCTDYEFIIIDGGSSDGSKALLEQFTERITYWISEPDKGIYNAMNKGIQKAKGEYLIFMNSGDRFSSSTILEKIIPHFESKDFVYGNAYYELENRKKYEYRIPSVVSIGSLLKEPICHQATFFKKALFEKYGLYSEAYKIAADWVYMMDLFLKHNISQKYINEYISIFEKTGISSTHPELGRNDQQKYLSENISQDIQNMAKNYAEYAKFYHTKPAKLLRKIRDFVYRVRYGKPKFEKKLID